MTTMRSIFLIFLFLPYFILAQPTSPLDRVVSVDVRNERVSEVLRQVSQQADFAFSYNPAVVNDTRLVTLRTGRQPVRIVLTRLFTGQAVTWKVRGNHVLLLGEGESRRANPGRANPGREPTHFFLDGYITDEQTGQKITSVSIYERTSLASTVSNPYGYYRLKLARDLPTNARVEVRKRLYVGESVTISTRQSRTVDVRLRALPTPSTPATTTVTTAQPVTIATTPVDTIIRQAETPPVIAQIDTIRPSPPERSTARPDSLPSHPSNPTDSLPAPTDSTNSPQRLTGWEQTRNALGQAYEVARQIIHRQNLNADTLYRPFQLSLLPYIGTNHRLSNHVINHLSINVFMGTALGVTGLELGGFVNNIRADVRGGQFAGFGNFVGRNVYGFQAAGFINQVSGELKGGQFAGFGNITRRNFAGIQAAGFFNKVSGQSSNTIQLAGFSNKIRGNSRRIVQAAGFSNKTRDLRDGLQIAGFVNRARTVRNGLQIAPINIADSSNSVPIGLLSFVRQNGYRRFEIAANETFPVNLTFRTGVKWFYNLLSIGMNPTDAIGNRTWQAGYGIGTGVKLGRSWMVTVEGSVHVVWASPTQAIFGDGSPALILRGTPTLEKRFGRLALAVGPSLAFYNTEATLNNPDNNPLANSHLRIQNAPLVSSLPFSNNGWTSWLGWQAGLRWTN